MRWIGEGRLRARKASFQDFRSGRKWSRSSTYSFDRMIDFVRAREGKRSSEEEFMSMVRSTQAL